MTTDDLRSEYSNQVSFNCKYGDEAFTDGYVLWLEHIIINRRIVVKQKEEHFIDKYINTKNKNNE